MTTPHAKPANPLLAGIDGAAMLVGPEELTEALILVFDSELRFTLVAGHALATRRATAPSTARASRSRDAFPAELWREIEPLCRSALAGRHTLAQDPDARTARTA